jgi:hypothetical protein
MKAMAKRIVAEMARNGQLGGNELNALGSRQPVALGNQLAPRDKIKAPAV